MTNLMLPTLRALLSLLAGACPPLAHRLVFRWFIRPCRRSPVQASEAPAMEAARVQHLNIEGRSVRVYRWGNGERPVLLVHGWGSRGARYALLAHRLVARGFSPVTFDAPGHGESGGRTTTILDYQLVIQALSRECGTFEAIVAHSFGVPCAFHAVKRGVSTRRLVALAGVSDFDYLVEAFSRTLRLKPALVGQLRRNVEALFAPLQDIWKRFSVTHDAHVLGQPVMFVHDRADDVVQFAQTIKSVQHFGQQARLMATAGLGHHRIVSDGHVLEAVCAFIARPLAPVRACVPADEGRGRAVSRRG